MNKKGLLAIVLMLTVVFTFAQDKKDVQKDGWKKGGTVGITFNQTAFNNEWTGGGIANTAANILVNYDFNLTQGDLVWDNKIIAEYGINKNKGDENYTKNNDRLEFNSLAGKKMKGFWYYSAYFNMKTQMDRTRDGQSHFFSPAFFQIGPGMLWKKSDNLNVNISPAAAKITTVHAHYTDVPSVLTGAFKDAYIKDFNEKGGYYGVEANETMRFELGASVRAYYKTDLMKNISMENILGLYTNYLEEPQNVDVDYTMNLIMTVNKYISANFTFQAIYDDTIQREGFQVREGFGAGLNFTF